MCRLRSCWPLLQVLVQTLQAPYLVSLQSTGHGWGLHFLLWTVAGHLTPPNEVAVWTLRVRVLLPVPHEAPHLDHLPKSLVTQSTGHFC